MENQESNNVANPIRSADNNNIQYLYKIINALIEKVNNKDFRNYIDEKIIEPVKESVQHKIRPYLYYLAILYIILIVLMIIILYYVIRIHKSQLN